MRTTQAKNQRRQAWDGEEQVAWNRYEENTVWDLKCIGPPRLVTRDHNGSAQGSGKQSTKTSDILFRQQYVLKTTLFDEGKKGNVKNLIKSNSLPPIYGTNVRSVQVKQKGHQTPELYKNAIFLSNKTLSMKKSAWRQNDFSNLTSSVDFIYRNLGTLDMTKSCQDSESVQSAEAIRSLVLTLNSNSQHFDLNETEPRDSLVKNKAVKDSASIDHHSQVFSYTAIRTEDSLRNIRIPEKEKGEEEVFYTTEMISDWIIRVNESLFSPFKDELNKTHLLKEEDVDTIKIIYEE